MKVNVQPLPTQAASSRTTPRDAARLLCLWIDLTIRANAAAAHGHEDEAPLFDLREQVDTAIRERHHRLARTLRRLEGWEAELVHTGDSPSRRCLICRRARLGLPSNLPMPGSKEGRR